MGFQWQNFSYPSIIGFESTPTWDISISQVSPGHIQTFGSRLDPTPPGVPVAMTSPGTNSVKVEI